MSSLGRAEPWSCSPVGDDGGAAGAVDVADAADVMEEGCTDDMDASLSEQSNPLGMRRIGMNGCCRMY